MEIKTRTTPGFIEIKVSGSTASGNTEEIETTIFKSDREEIRAMTDSLLEVVWHLQGYLEETQ